MRPHVCNWFIAILNPQCSCSLLEQKPDYNCNARGCLSFVRKREVDSHGKVERERLHVCCIETPSNRLLAAHNHIVLHRATLQIDELRVRSCAGERGAPSKRGRLRDGTLGPERSPTRQRITVMSRNCSSQSPVTHSQTYTPRHASQ